MLPSSLAWQDAFPYDALDEIFCFACEDRLKRALDLGTVCRYWYQRFIRNDRMWALLSRTVIKIARPRKDFKYDGGAAPNWDTYAGVRRAVEVAKQFAPIPPAKLHTLNACQLDIEDIAHSSVASSSPWSPTGQITSLHMKFRCPLVLEALTLAEPSVAACHLCNRKVYKVQNQEELDERRRKGDCVWMEPNDLDPNAQVRMDIEVALFAADFDQAVKALSEIAEDDRVAEHSTSMFPMFLVRIPIYSKTFNVRFTTFCFSSENHESDFADDSNARRTTTREIMVRYPHRFTYLWFRPPAGISEHDWVPELRLARNASRAERVKFAVASAVLRQPLLYPLNLSSEALLRRIVNSAKQDMPDVILGLPAPITPDSSPSFIEVAPQQDSSTPKRRGCCRCCCSVQ